MNHHDQLEYEVDKELAELQGYHRFIRDEDGILYADKPNQNLVRVLVPRPARSNEECFKLAIVHDITYKLNRDFDEIVTNYYVIDDINDFASDFAAVRYAIMKSVIMKLKSEQEE